MDANTLHPDLIEPDNIIQNFRDLNNMETLLDYDAEVSKYVKRLKEAGWAAEKIHNFQNIGAIGTRFDQDLPHVMKNNGDQLEYQRNKGRTRK